MISIVAKFTVDNGQEEKFLNLISELSAASNAEEGCIEYILNKNTAKPNSYCIIEKWKDQTAIDIHNNSAHFTKILPKIAEIAKAEVDVYQPV